MNNSTIADNLAYLGKLYDLHNLQAELAKSLSNAAFQIDKLNSPMMNMSENSIANCRGITPQILILILELLSTKQCSALQQLIDSTPEGILQMMQIKGLGPKKLRIVWQDMKIENPAELLYACNENRLIHFKGFGEKLQQSILEATEFFLNSEHKYLFAKIKYFVDQLFLYFTKLKKWQVAITGDVARQCNIIEQISFVIVGDTKTISAQLDAQYFSDIKILDNNCIECISHQIKFFIYCCTELNFGTTLFNTSCSAIFLEDFKKYYQLDQCSTEQEIFIQNNLPFISPIIREYTVQQSLQLPQHHWIQFADIKGIIHNHSTYSDGLHTLQEMTQACIDAGYQYFVISDHSQYASYANGLKPEKIIQQHTEINSINKTVLPFKIYKSIECDILPDGSLDYTPAILQTFDVIVASVHSVLNMTQEKAMERLLCAIQNPYTNILGHPTGRLLLGRKGYPLDMKKIIDACAMFNVAIELNANPRRLDLDWQWIPYAVSKNVLISINPDAHKMEGILDNQYGVLSAQKAGLLPHQNLSSFTILQFENWMQEQHLKRPKLINAIS
jgi:DNA polymerase (family X)